MLYIFSPLLIAFYVLPATSKITSALYRSLFMVASWKVVWCVLAAILWSAALIDLEQLSKEANFLTICIFNIMLAVSLLLTPFIANSFLSQGLGSITPKVGTAAVGMMGVGAKHIIKFVKHQNSLRKNNLGSNLSRRHRKSKAHPSKNLQSRRKVNQPKKPVSYTHLTLPTTPYV